MDKKRIIQERARKAITQIARRDGIPEERVRAEMLAAMRYCVDSKNMTARCVKSGPVLSGSDITPESFIAWIVQTFF